MPRARNRVGPGAPTLTLYSCQAQKAGARMLDIDTAGTFGSIPSDSYRRSNKLASSAGSLLMEHQKCIRTTTSLPSPRGNRYTRPICLFCTDQTRTSRDQSDSCPADPSVPSEWAKTGGLFRKDEPGGPGVGPIGANLAANMRFSPAIFGVLLKNYNIYCVIP